MPAPTPYCTAADLEAVIGREALIAAAPDPDTADGIDTAVVDRTITAVSSQIDGWLRTRYTLPLADVPETLRRVAARLVHAELVHEDTITDLIESRRTAAQKVLEQMAAGAIRLGGDLDDDPNDRNRHSGAGRAHVTRRTLQTGRRGLQGVV